MIAAEEWRAALEAVVLTYSLYGLSVLLEQVWQWVQGGWSHAPR